MRSILLTASMLIAGSTLAPEVWCQSNSGPVVIEKNFYAPNHRTGTYTNKVQHSMTLEQAKAKVRSTRAEDETMYKVTFKIDGYNPEEEGWSTGFLGYTLVDGRDSDLIGIDEEENGNFQYELPAGTYTLLATLQKFVFDGTGGVYIAIKEDVVVNEDMTVTLPLSDISNHIVFDMVMPDGTPPLSILQYEDGTYKQKGNMYESSLYAGVYSKESYTNLMMYSSHFDIWYENGELVDPSLNFNFYVSDNSTLAFLQSRVYAWTGGTVIGGMSSVGSDTQNVSIVASEYKPLEAEFAEIDNSFAANGTIDTTDEFRSYTYMTILGNHWCATSGYNTYMPEGEWNYKKFYISQKSSDYPVEVYPVIFNEIMSVMDVTENGNIFYGNFGINTPVGWCTDNDYSFGNWHTIASSNLKYKGPFEDFNVSYSFPERWPWVMNPLYTFVSTKENPVKFGATCPFTLFMRWGNQLAYYPVGAHGELRSIDWINSGVNIKRKNKNICDNYFDYVDMVTNQNEMRMAGPWDFTIDNTNFSLDGVKGRNYAEIHIAKTEADGLFPTMTGYAPRTATGEICNKFNDTKDNAVFSFTAGSFYHVFDMETFRISFLYTPLTEVKVEYAPYNTEEWQVFNVNEVEDKFFMPGWGAYYEGALSQIDRKALNGCFDVRISLADEAGNTQVQTISPAFVIESLSGVERVSEKTEGIYVNGRDIIAPANAQVYRISGQISGRTQLEPGIYIVRSNGTNKKVIVK